MKMKQKTAAEHKQLADGSDEVVESVENPTLMITKAVLLLVLGTAMAAVFADPLVDAVHNFSLATSIPSFFISFIFMPLATNSSEAVSAIIFASRKKQRTSSLTFSEVSNLSVLFFLVFVRSGSFYFIFCNFSFYQNLMPILGPDSLKIYNITLSL